MANQTSSSSPPLIVSNSGLNQIPLTPIITKLMVPMAQPGNMSNTCNIQNYPMQSAAVSSIYVVGQASSSRLQYVSMVGNIAMPSSISFDPPHSLTMPQKMASRMALTKPRLALPIQQSNDQGKAFISDQKSATLISPVPNKNASIVSSLVSTSKSAINSTNIVPSSTTVINSSLISPTSLAQQRFLLPQTRSYNANRPSVPLSALAFSFNQPNRNLSTWPAATHSVVSISQLINKPNSSIIHQDMLQRPSTTIGHIRPVDNATLLLVANPFQGQSKALLSPILPGPINLSTQSNKNVQSQALNLTINNRQQTILLTSSPSVAFRATSIPIPSNLIINKLGTSPLSGQSLTRQKKNVRLNPASATTLLNQHGPISIASKQGHTVVSIQPVASQLLQQSQPNSSFTPIAKVTPQLHLFQQQQLQQQQLQQLQNQQQLQGQDNLLQNSQLLQTQNLQLMQSQQQLQNQQQTLHLLHSHQQMQNQQNLQTQHQLQSQQALHCQQKLQSQQFQQLQPQNSSQQPKASSINNQTQIRLQTSQFFSVSQQGRVQPRCETAEEVQIQAALLSPSVSLGILGLPVVSFPNDASNLQSESRALGMAGEDARLPSVARLMPFLGDQVASRTVSQSIIPANVQSQALLIQPIKTRQQNMASMSQSVGSLCFAGTVVTTGKLQPYFDSIDSPKTIINFHESSLSVAETGPSTAAQVLLTSSIFQQQPQQQQSSIDVISKHQQLTPQQNSSPRPSILRNVFVSPNIRKNLMAQMSAQSNDVASQNDVPLIITNTQIASIEIKENSQSSTDTASSSESTPKPKPSFQENSNVVHKLNNGGKMTPRKKPRKQSLHMCEEAGTTETVEDEGVILEDNGDDEDEVDADVDDEPFKDMLQDKVIRDVCPQEDISEYVDKDGLRWTLEKRRPNITMSQQYHCSWKPRYNHFNSIADVKPKEEKRQSLNEIANQKSIHDRISGSKLFLIAAQFDQLRDEEQELVQQLSKFKDNILSMHNDAILKISDEELANLEELTMANIQRSQTCALQYDEVTDLLLKLLDGKTKVVELLTKHQSKRSAKKKDKNS